tara:strand:- start:754 stop:900 length:147 start_codon:yes stop_codon:yes gene_type:complete
MTYSTEEQKHLKELKQNARTCHDPFDLIAELAYENERLRTHIKKIDAA